jgi:hypothetical protein
MKAKKLVSLAIPVLLLVGCTTDTYGLTQSEFRKVDKEFKADEMIEHMKKMHYKDEEIEKQLKGALAQLEYEEEQRNEKKSNKKSTSETEVDDKKDNAIVKENQAGYGSKGLQSPLYVSATEFPDMMFKELIDLKYEMRDLIKESKAISEDRYEGSPKDTVVSIRGRLDELDRVVIPKKYADYEYIIKEGIENMRDSLPKIEKAIDKYEDPSKDKKKVKEEVDDAIDGLDSDTYTWQPFFADMNEKDPTALKRAIKFKQDGSKKAHDSFGEGTLSTTDESINYTPKK